MGHPVGGVALAREPAPVPPLRSSYGEGRRLADAPGQVFGRDELADLTTFVQVSLLCVWDFHLLPSGAQLTAFVSRDGFAHLYPKDRANLDVIRQELSAANVEFSVRG